MVEDWLTRRDQVDHIREDTTGYLKVLEVYVLHILPRLDDWEYAQNLVMWDQEVEEGERKVRHFILNRYES